MAACWVRSSPRRLRHCHLHGAVSLCDYPQSVRVELDAGETQAVYRGIDPHAVADLLELPKRWFVNLVNFMDGLMPLS